MNIHLHFEKDIVDCMEFGTKEDFLEILKVLSTKIIRKSKIREKMRCDTYLIWLAKYSSVVLDQKCILIIFPGHNVFLYVQYCN
jgi:hypothetical protein